MKKPVVENPEFADYFRSELHESRMNEARVRTVRRMTTIGSADVFAMLSDGVGTLFGVAEVYRNIGLKHNFNKILQGLHKWMRSGTD